MRETVVIICQTKTTVFMDYAYFVLIVLQLICWCSNLVPNLFFKLKKNFSYVLQWVFVVKMWFPSTCYLFSKSHSGFRKTIGWYHFQASCFNDALCFSCGILSWTLNLVCAQSFLIVVKQKNILLCFFLESNGQRNRELYYIVGFIYLFF